MGLRHNNTSQGTCSQSPYQTEGAFTHYSTTRVIVVMVVVQTHFPPQLQKKSLTYKVQF